MSNTQTATVDADAAIKAINQKQAERLLEEAAECERRRQESFDRCDTDGFMSQAASSAMADVYRAKARIAQQNGRDQFNGLYDGSRRVAARIVEGQFGASWLLREDEQAKYGRAFVPLGYNSRIQKQLGLQTLQEMAPAAAKCGGWHGATVYRTGDKWGLDAVLCEVAP
jgi:hypothetical protein